jgi:carboxyl-terminal processing protease
VVVLEETYAKSAILTRDGDGTKYGYINLPGFYVDFNDENGRACAADVLKEVQRLSVNDIAGTIIDLRNNGGGSLEEVRKMVGIFIESGPVVLVDDKTGKSQALKDGDSRIQDTKPLIVLVNGFSASASEIFAAAIQDYHRGVIMGTESTFGKGSVQRIYELSQFKAALNQDVQDEDLGSIKITQSKFFRINGGSTQLKGVVPDIIMPDLYSGMKQGEKEEDFAMQWTKIKKSKYSVYKSEPHYKLLQTEAKLRLDTTSYFKLLNQHLELVRKEEKNTLQSLKYADFDRDMKELKKSSEQMEAAIKGLNAVHADYLKDEKVKVESDKALKERLKGFHESLLHDEYIYQALITLGQMK